MTDAADRTGTGERTRLADARDRIRDAVALHGRVEERPPAAADGRVLASPVEARRDVPHVPRAAVAGYAVRAADTFGASERAPATLDVADPDADTFRGDDGRAEEDGLPEGTALQVAAGSQVPAGADAVVPLRAVDRRDDAVELVDPVAEGDGVTPVGADVAAGEAFVGAGERLRPSTLGLCAAAGVDAVRVAARPTVAVVPVGDELVAADPGPGEVVASSGPTVAALAGRWGGAAEARDPVSDYRTAVRNAVEDDLEADVVVTAGGLSGGADAVVPAVVDGLGEVLVRGLAVRPGGRTGAGVVDGTPVVMLPGAPVAALVGAVQVLRPVVAWLAGAEPARLPAEELPLARKVPSEPGVRTFARVAVESGVGGDRRATPVATGSADLLSSVTSADGWVVVPESREGVPSGETVRVQDWEWSG